MFPDEIKLLDIVRKYAQNTSCLNVYRFIPEICQLQVQLNNKVEYLPLNTESYQINIKDVFVWTENFYEFVDIAVSTKTRYRFIILAPNQGDINFQLNHKNVIKTLQNYILHPNGIMILLIRDSSFILDPYIRPGADRITKYTLSQNLIKTNVKPHQSYAFYGLDF